jgi:hypothetical protein
VPIFAVVLVALRFIDAEAGEDTPREEIVLADTIRAAYYKVAPRDLAASMRRAVAESCDARAAANGSRLVDGDPWLCDGTALAFLREVDVFGDRLEIGFVCRGRWARRVHYVDEQISHAIEERKCVPVWFNIEANAHFLDRVGE